MKSKTSVTLCAFVLLLMGSAISGFAKEKAGSGEMVDSGTLSVFMNGRKVATETFSIHQADSGSVVTSEFKTEQAADRSVQSSELQLTSSGDIRQYEWKEVSPGKAQALVVPNESFLIERSKESPDAKQQEQPFLLPASTSILDDYFFVHREVLVWRYLATTCKQEKGQVQCPANQKTQFGVLNPHARSSMQVTLEFTGREKITVHGAESELNRFNLKGDSGEWALWVDDKFKLVRVLVASDNTEVVRD